MRVAGGQLFGGWDEREDGHAFRQSIQKGSAVGAATVHAHVAGGAALVWKLMHAFGDLQGPWILSRYECRFGRVLPLP